MEADENLQPKEGNTLPAAGADPLRDKLYEDVNAIAEKSKDSIQQAGTKIRENTQNALASFAGAIRAAGNELQQQDNSTAARLVSEAASGLERLSHAATETRLEDAVSKIRDFGRERPAAFIAGSILAGIALGRLARAAQPLDAFKAEKAGGQ